MTLSRAALLRVAPVVTIALAVLAALLAIRIADHDAPDQKAATQVGTLVLTRTGGFGGWDDRLVVFPDGIWVEARLGWEPIKGRLSDSERRRLGAALVRVDPGHRSSGHGEEETCCDQLFYTLEYLGSHYDTADEHVPVSVQDELDLLKPQLEARHAVATLTP